eukprot:3507275-Alexandrium_andersonii.AAC.1
MFDGAPGQPRSEPVWEALINLAMEWHMRAEDPTEKTLTDLKRQVGLLVTMYGEDREKAREMAREIIER